MPTMPLPTQANTLNPALRSKWLFAVSGGVGAGWVCESPWFCRRLGLLDFDQGLVGPLGIVERGLELCRG